MSLIRFTHGVAVLPRAHSLAHLLTHFSFHPGTPCCPVHATLAHASTHASVPLIPHTVTHVCAISAFPKPPSRAINRSDAHTRSHANDTSSSSTTPRRVSEGCARTPKTAFVTTTAVAAPMGAARSASWTMMRRRVRITNSINHLFSGRGRDGFVAKEERYLSLQWRDLEKEWNVDQRIPLRIRW